MHKWVNENESGKKCFFEIKSDLPMEKRASGGAETHAGDMQKLYLTAPAQCRGAAQNVNPQKYDPL